MHKMLISKNKVAFETSYHQQNYVDYMFHVLTSQKIQADITINDKHDNIGLLLISTLLYEHTTCKSLMHKL